MRQPLLPDHGTSALIRFADWQRHGKISGRQRDWQVRDLAALRELARGAERGF
ncbi:hypothetical protein [Pseudoxanthomonas indica]|uniref:hypothetical protein n=1 Tax=Pseudoxanthomonas indica TaxID=428993 RepID=UPI001C3770E5|nr:hypothetical protein [Pseudoxanthomonas indica]